MSGERWLAVPGYEGLYQVSDQGDIRSLDRTVFHASWGSRLIKGRILKPWLDPKGYLTVSLWKGGVEKRFGAHRVVLLAFVGPRPDGLEIRHLDGNPLNNSFENLAYGTHAENTLDRIRHQTSCRRGHPYPAEWLLEPMAGRRCRVCQRARQRRKDARRSAAAHTNESAAS